MIGCWCDSVEELVDLLYVHRRAAKTVESLIEVSW